MNMPTANNPIIKYVWSKNKIAQSTLWGVFFLLASLFINFEAGTYASEKAGAGVKDIILDHLPVMDVDGIFIYGIITFFIFFTILLFLRPSRAPFMLKSLSIFIIIRSFFIVLTHIGPAPQAILLTEGSGSVLNYFTFTGDLFFSGHTGLPLLLALTFWRDRYLRVIFLASSVLFGLVVLLGHLHYSIDVFAAFFITYGIFQIVTKLFKKDYQLLMSQYDN